VLAEAGRLFEPYARHVVAALDDSRRAIAECRGLEKGALSIGASTTRGIVLTVIIGQHNSDEIVDGFTKRIKLIYWKRACPP